ARLDLLLLAGHDLRGPPPAARALRAAAPLPLHPVGRARVCLGEGRRVRHHLRLLDPLRAPAVRAPDGGGGLPPPGPGLPDRRLQERDGAPPAPRVGMCAGARASAPHTPPVLLRL